MDNKLLLSVNCDGNTVFALASTVHPSPVAQLVEHGASLISTYRMIKRIFWMHLGKSICKAHKRKCTSQKLKPAAVKRLQMQTSRVGIALILTLFDRCNYCG